MKAVTSFLSSFLSSRLGIVHKARASKNVGASRKNVKQVVALRARTSDQWGASRKNVKQMLALRAKLSEKSLIEGGMGIRGAKRRGCPFLLQ